ncbi:DNA polymerase III subunit gamma/tau [Flavobacterium azooxidireducens]|uniref:DNA polymerase III subunit gamma/tau n=1 Tax=Flavobacterium azooxidireducens TaxID=1871076 RepID=A0ABY4KET2_9FLAO|nr:DNA polymerase III subunit gamma/tau [Flavobacterium azooxidireducens]UPQ79306.1 DNA polymerase III subunit gamma/tau [Flavobacterium azooxidireducens]
MEVVPNVPKETPKVETPSSNEPVVEETIKPKIDIPIISNGEPKVSAFSLASIKQKKELAEAQKLVTKEAIQYPTEPFNETDMLLQWNKFALKLEEKGQMIMHSLMLINDPKLNGYKITHELPNEGTRLEFERTKNEVLGYLRGMLHNHDIEIELVVNEKMENKRAFTPQDKFNRLNEINPNLELLRKTFDLDV